MKNKITQFVVDLLPERVIYFAYIRFMAYVTTHDVGVAMTPDEVTFSKAMGIWNRSHWEEDKYHNYK